MQTFQEVRDYLAEIPNIHRGGCGHSALAMYKWLEKNNELVEDTRIVYLYCHQTGNYETNSKALEGNGEFVAPSHVVLAHKGQHIDAKSDHAYNGWFDEESHTLNDVQELITTFGAPNWNDNFDRNHVDSINETLGLN